MAKPLPDISVLWVEGPLSRLEQLAMASMVAQGHAVKLYTYDDALRAPPGVTRIDGREILPREKLFRNQGLVGKGSWAPFANQFRYQLLLEHGGVWCDLDLVLLKPLDFIGEDVLVGGEMVPTPGERGAVVLVPKAATCFIAAPRGHEAIAMCLERARAIGAGQKAWGESGVEAFRRVVEHFGQGTRWVLNPNILCSIPPWEIAKLVSGFHPIEPIAHGLHFWNEIWRWNFLDKDGRYEPLSVYERLKRHYLGEAS